MNYSEMSMHELFRLEAENQASVLTQGLLDIENDLSNEGSLEKLMRASHSIKGAARMVGIEEIVAIAHLMEDCFVTAQQDKLNISSKVVDVLLKAVDAIVFVSRTNEEDVAITLENHKSEYSRLIQGLNRVLEAGNKPGNKLKSVKKKRTRKKSINHKSVIKDTKKERISNDIKTSHSGDSNSAKQDKRIVRVDAEGMNRLLALSGEMTVESRWLHPFSRSLNLLKRDYSELSDIIENLRESLLHRDLISNEDNFLFSAAQSKLSDCRNTLTDKQQNLDDFERRNSSLSSRIFNEIIASRMRPFSDATQGLQRTVRDLSRKMGKNIKLETSGLDVLIDRDVIDGIKSPLVHLIRNAVDHGIELPEERTKADKDECGIIKLSAFHGGGLLVIRVADDGQGVDLDVLKARILDRNLASNDILENLTEAELLTFLYLPDFSTRDSVSEISGRGVGLDLVHDLVTGLHGTIWAENVMGAGLEFVMQLPVTLSVISAIVVKINNENYAFPVSRIDRLESVPVEDISIIDGKQYIRINEMDILLVSAADVLELGVMSDCQNMLNIVVISDRNNTFGVVVDEYAGQSDLSVQSLDGLLGKVQDISAAALTRDGEAVLIIDVDDLMNTILKNISEDSSGSPVISRSADTQVVKKKILVVDDSLTVREVERKLLEGSGYFVDVAVDGVDGWNALRRTKYNLLVTDVDMPRMDGIELIKQMKKTEGLQRLPVMIVSYKDRSEDRQRGLDAGADYYLAKGSFQDETLLEAVVDLIGDASEARTPVIE